MRRTLSILTVCALALTGMAQEQAQSNFRAGEFALDLSGGVTSPDLDAERTSYGFGAQYYLTKSLGVGAYTTLENLSGHTFENISFRGLWRVPVHPQHALYAFGGVRRQFHDDTHWALELGPGYEWRPIKRIGVFAEAGLDKQWTGLREASAIARGGLRIAF